MSKNVTKIVVHTTSRPQERRASADSEHVELSPSAGKPLGERFGRYVLLEMIGRGGMAEVYRAMVQGLEGFERVFVIKRILRAKSASPEFVEMFINEARISALLNHPNIVQTYDFGQIDGSYFLAMEYLRGKDLLSVLRRLRALGRHVPPEVAAYIAQQVALGLDWAHNLAHGGKRLNLIHRDVSPSNVMLLREGGVKLLDFGIAKAAMEARSEPHSVAGFVKGKLSYVSPEQVRATTSIDARADIFALGVVLWETLTGKRLFYDRNDFQTMRNVLERPVPPPSTQRLEAPATLDFIALRALERERDRRYPTARAMAEELETFLQDVRFAPRAMTRMLDDLFGEANLPDVISESPGAMIVPVVPALGVVGPPGNEAPRALATMPLLRADDEEESYTGVSTVHRMLERRRQAPRPWLTAAAAVVFVAGGGITLVQQYRDGRVHDQPTASARPPETSPGAAASAPATPTAAAPALGLPALAAASAVLPAAPGAVSVTVESDPSGAEIKDKSGRRLGITPAALSLDRGLEPVSLTLSKAGHFSRSHTLVPERDVSLVITLRPNDPRAKKADRVRRRARR